MTNYDSGDIVISEFPFTDKSESKIRPVLILSNSEYNESRSNIIAAQITSQYSSFEAFYLKNWIELGLHEPSEITYNIATIPQKFITQKCGRLTQGQLTEIKKRIAKIMNITNTK